MVGIISHKEKAAQLKQSICALLQWDELQYGNFQYESGLAYLRHYITHDKWGQDLLQRTRLFWNWWRNEWAKRDEGYLSDHEEKLHLINLTTRRSLYYHVHNAATLASEIYPDRVILDDSYNQMIRSVIKEAVHG